MSAADRHESVRVLSLGAGVQSTCLLLLSVEGVLPRLDFAIFADTGWEPQEVYDHLDSLRRYADEQAGIPVLLAQRRTASGGKLHVDAMDRHVFATIPAWTTSGRIIRQCTPKYKVEPLEQTMREQLGAKVWEQPCSYCDSTGRRVAPWDIEAGEGPCSVCNGSGTRRRVGSVPAGVRVEQWIGFSTDEVERATTAGFPSYVTVRHPLLDLGMTRSDCIQWMADRGWSGVTKSSCLGCPFHDDDTWLAMADDEPDVFAELVAYDRAFRNAPGLNDERFLNEMRVPLGEAVERYRALKEARGEQLVLWEQFKAKRRVRRCNPFGCRVEELDDDVPVMMIGAAS